LVLNKVKLFTVCPFLSWEIIIQMIESYVLSPQFTDIFWMLFLPLQSSSRSKGICIFNESCCKYKTESSKELTSLSSHCYHFIP
jgi:hypothetical protein